MNRIFDASAMIAFLRGEDGKDVVRNILRDPANKCHAHSAQMAEVYWNFCTRDDEATACDAIAELVGLQICVWEDYEDQLMHHAMRMRSIAQMSFADAIGIALAQRLGGDFITGDRHDLITIHNFGWVPVCFIRPSSRKPTKRQGLEAKLLDAIANLKVLDQEDGVSGDWRDRAKAVLDGR